MVTKQNNALEEFIYKHLRSLSKQMEEYRNAQAKFNKFNREDFIKNSLPSETIYKYPDSPTKNKR